MNILSIIVEIIKIIGTGIVSGVIASLCYAGIKRLIRPRIDIAPFVIVHPLSGTVKYFSKDFHCNTIEEVRIGDNIVFTDGDNMQYKEL